MYESINIILFQLFAMLIGGLYGHHHVTLRVHQFQKDFMCRLKSLLGPESFNLSLSRLGGDHFKP